jgi:CHAD domain-containing protein
MVTKNKTKKASVKHDSIVNTIALTRQHLSGQHDSEYIHRIRVDIKHLRAWLRLTRISDNGLNWKIMDAELRDQAKLLGTTRDIQAIDKTLKSLKHYIKTDAELQSIAYLHENLCHEHISIDIDWDKTIESLEQTLDDFEQCYSSNKSLSALEKGLKLTYSKCKKRGKKVFFKHGTYDDLHNLRKWVKTLAYQLGYINKRHTKLKSNIELLGEILGQTHDFIIIKDKIKLLKKNKNLKVANTLIDEHIKLMIKNAKPLYKKTFKLSTKEFLNT